MGKKVSVIIPTYNRACTIKKAIESVLNQTYKNIEIIVVDDNSNDDTNYVIKKYLEKYKFIRYIKHEYNKGGSAARNTGAANSSGDILAFLDSDDEWISNKLEEDLKCIVDDDFDMVYCDMYAINSKTGEKEAIIKKSYDDIYYELLKRNIIGGTSLITIKKQVFNQVGGFNEGLPSCQDWEFYIKVARKYKIKKINKCLLNYYIHSDSISGNITNAIQGHQYMFNMVSDIIETDEKYSDEKNIILSEHYITIAMIYRRFKDYKMIRDSYKKAIKLNYKNTTALKNIMCCILGRRAYFYLIKRS